ncbi:MAG: hypothetical protein K9G67_09295 [Bacteroidales bacterium]|nr:hypothetical protein [Bacteroidales bacterium]MCF8345145.1 hypothetical protein [Bacteroidales bacterium]MCF8350642.1 hypothetical protein [Bacteroidales bacterium]MCF8376536.1 hypothetical protein [Bacteroidales bacterium]MCF8400612.1 hypothetical protein [Bacteroidales bacterium]
MADKTEISVRAMMGIVILLILIIVGYFTYPQWKGWFRTNILNEQIFNIEGDSLTGNDLIDKVWINDLNGAILSLKRSKNYTLDIPSVEDSKTVHGHFVLEKNSISFMTHPSTNVCVGLEGIYKYRIDRERLLFTKVMDRCSSRQKYMESPWISYDSY